MPSLNKVMLIGYVVRDLQMRTSGNGNSWCDIDMVMHRVYRGVDGIEKKDSVYVSVLVMGKMAVDCSQTLHKGSRIYAEGRLYQSTWTDKTTNTKCQKLKVVAEHILFLSPKDNQMHEVDECGNDAAEIGKQLQHAAAARPPKKENRPSGNSASGKGYY